MANFIKEHELKAVEAVVSAHPEGVAINDIQDELEAEITASLLRYRLKRLVLDGRLVKEGSGRWTKYRSPGADKGQDKAAEEPGAAEPEEVPLSKQASEIRKFVRKPFHARPYVGYQRSFLESYIPNKTAYLSEAERDRLRRAGTQSSDARPAGTLARQILYDLLIDLSWNSSRLEGNTYSLLETKRLLDFGVEADGKSKTEALMILNHKSAIMFLVDSADAIRFDRETMLQLHAHLADDLLSNPLAPGRLRRISVGIQHSTYLPLRVPEVIEECFDLLLGKADEIEDPYEQSLFVMVQLPYLQPFEDVNKRTSRLAANIPLFKANLTPISFTEVPTRTYTEAMLGVYEMNRIDLLKDVFIWACERSAERHKMVRDETGEADPFRFKHRLTLRFIIQNIVLDRLDRKSAFERIADLAVKLVEAEEQERFREMAEEQVLALHVGNYSVYRIARQQFDAWQEVWNRPVKSQPPQMRMNGG